MIERGTRESIASLTKEYWNAQVETPEFRGLFAGKEIGHRIADYVDERTTVMLERSFETKHELSPKGKARPRSMGDVWIQSNGLFNPINVKAGEDGKNGQPNMVSLTKLIDALLRRSIDSYYLLIVKMRLASLPASVEVPPTLLAPETITANVYFVDMLDHLSFVTFDSGPGQAMLKEQSFYEAVDSGYSPPRRALEEKVQALIDLLEDGDRRLIVNRQRKMQRIRADFSAYKHTSGHVVSQEGLNLG